MQLVTLELFGYRRFVQAKVNLDAPVVAILGPNEAGKTSLLRALIEFETDTPIPIGSIWRGDQPGLTSKLVLQALFLLDGEDVQAIAGVWGSSASRWFVLRKWSTGRLDGEVLPALERDPAYLRQFVDHLTRLRDAPAEEDTEADVEPPEYGELLDSLPLAGAELPGEVAASLDRALGAQDLFGELPDAESLKQEGMAALQEARRDPNAEAVALLLPRRPRFLLFDDDDRLLASEYDLEEIADSPPASLRNLVAMAGLDLVRARDLGRAGDRVGRERALWEAAETVTHKLRASWKRAPELRVSFHCEGQILQIYVETAPGQFQTLADRSDGLRAFLALAAFVEHSPRGRPLVLLIDEAEAHLHYDAQADLVQVFETQTAVGQTIYTTHSAGCLPSDLGTGVRVVQADGERSTISNAFWTSGGGFSPLVIGMGATVFAFIPARYAVMAEGATELILLPSILREATGLDRLGFQVAPGLAEASPSVYQHLETEAGRVAYLVDGDDEGDRLRGELIGAGIDSSRVVSLGDFEPGFVLEDLLDADAYAAAINEQLRRSGAGPRIAGSDLPTPNRPRALRTWCEAQGVPEPNKEAVAQVLLDNRRDRPLSSGPQDVARRLHLALRAALRLPASPPD